MQENKIRVLIADDELTQLRLNVALVRRLRPDWEVVGEISCSSELHEAIAELSPTLCILDIQMDDISCIDMVREHFPGTPVIFVTAYANYAVDAFEYNALDYVVKPVRMERLQVAIERFEAKMEGLRSSRGGAIQDKPKMIRFSKGRDLVMAPLDNVSFFQAQHKYTRVVLKDQEGLLRMNISAVMQYLDPEKFWRIHRSYIANVGHIGSSKRDDMNRVVVSMKDRGDRLVVSKPYEHLFSRDGFS